MAKPDTTFSGFLANPLRRWGGGSLLVRTNIVLGASAFGIILLATLALDRYVLQPVLERSADDEAALLVLSAQTWVELPPDARPYFELELAESHDLIISSEARDFESNEPPDLRYADVLALKLSERLEQPVSLVAAEELMWVKVPMGGRELYVGVSEYGRAIQPFYVAFIIIVAGAAIVFLTSLFIVQRITRPLVRTARLAETFRGGVDFVALPEQGPREIVSLARNFNTMAREIAALMANRTTLLAGISHDLRTPLARMRLAVELLPQDVPANLKERLERNLVAMDHLIGDALQFAKGAGESPQQVRVAPWLRDLMEAHDEPVVVQIEVSEQLQLPLAVGALRRVIDNLLSNALQHATEVSLHARVGEADGRCVLISVEDGGPGIPAEFRSKVFQPFYRLDLSRSQSTGGSGLGLAIVSQLCQSHGWRASIGESSRGGASVQIAIPLAELAVAA